MDGRLVPGDRLIFVNDVNLESATLDEAVQALKGAQKGLVRIGVAKPLPLGGAFQDQAPMEEEPEVRDIYIFGNTDTLKFYLQHIVPSCMYEIPLLHQFALSVTFLAACPVHSS